MITLAPADDEPPSISSTFWCMSLTMKKWLLQQTAVVHQCKRRMCWVCRDTANSEGVCPSRTITSKTVFHNRLKTYLFMAALCNRGPLYFCPVISIFFYLLSSFFPRLISAAAYFDTWCGPSANLECRSEMCCSRLAANTGRKIAIWAPSHNFVALYLRNYGTY